MIDPPQCLDCIDLNLGLTFKNLKCSYHIAREAYAKKKAMNKKGPSKPERYGSHGLARKNEIGGNGYVDD